MDYPNQGYVYAVQMEGHPFYKLGRCNNVPRRMSEIGIQLPFPYRVVFARRVVDSVATESHLHKSLHRHRKNGEWFDLIPLQVELIGQILLIQQADELLDRLIEKLGERYAGKSPDVSRYAQLIHKSNQRALRREAQFFQIRNKVLVEEDPCIFTLQLEAVQ